MNLAEPTQVITPTLDGPVLMVLARAGSPLTGLEVHRLAQRGSPDGVRKALQRLAGQGVVESRSHGRAIVYTLNRQHLAADALVSLATLTTQLIEKMADEIRAWPIAPVHASLFGSAARSDGDEASDIDLLVVRPEGVAEMDEQWNRQLGVLKVAVWRWSGNDLQIIERSPSELRNESETPLVKGLVGEARLLAGTPLAGLLERTE